MERPGGRETAPAIGGTTTKLQIHAIAPRPITLVDGRSKCGSASRVEKVWMSASHCAAVMGLGAGSAGCLAQLALGRRIGALDAADSG